MNLTSYIAERRWFRGKARGLRDTQVETTIPLALGAAVPVELLVVRCVYAEGEPDRYVLFVAAAEGAAAATVPPHLVVAREEGGVVRYDALGSEPLLAALLARIGEGARFEGAGGALVLRPLPGFAAIRELDATPRPAPREQTNTSVVFGEACVVKILRQLEDGRSAELDMGEALTRAGYGAAPAVLGVLELERGGGAPAATVGVVHRFVANEGDAWSFTLAALGRDPDPAAYVPAAKRLGRRLGEMHGVLAAATAPDFAPVPLDRAAREALGRAVAANARAVSGALRPGDEAKVAARIAAFVELGHDPIALRIHGDLHLGQILVTGDDFVFLDFEGEPARSLAERKAKRSPLADVAGMLRSFDYAAASVLRGLGRGSATPVDPVPARRWAREVSAAFLAAYRASAPPAVVAAGSWDAALAFFLVEKGLYEIAYEANNRPDWLPIPREGLADLLDQDGAR